MFLKMIRRSLEKIIYPDEVEKNLTTLKNAGIPQFECDEI